MGLLEYIKANTPRATRPRVRPLTVINEGLLNPTPGNVANANRFKDSAFGLLGIIPGAGDYASGVQAADLWNRGEKLGAGMAALGALPFIPALGGMIKSIKPTKYELAQIAAQKNAVDMLGLPPGNTAMDRAKAQNYIPAYHGTGEDVKVIDNSKTVRNAYGQGLHVAAMPNLANIFAGHSKDGQNVMPLMVKAENPASAQQYKDELWNVWDKNKHHDARKIAENLQKKGFDSVKYNHGEFYYPDNGKLTQSKEGEDLSYSILKPQNVRSKFAAFDPARANESDLLAGIAPYLGLGGLFSLGLLTPDQAQASQ